MRSLATYLALAAIILSSPSFATTADDDRRDPNIEAIVLMNTDTPIIVGLDMSVGGKRYADHWEEGVRKLFKELDKDENGELSKQECRGIPSKNELSATNTRFFGFSRGPANVKRQELGPFRFDELANHLKSFAGPFRLNAVSNNLNRNNVYSAYGYAQGAQKKALELFVDRLDGDGDGMLAPSEFKVSTRLLKLDIDEDGCISQNELNAVAGGQANQYAFITAQANNQRPANVPFVHIDVSSDPSSFEKSANRLFLHYAKSRTSVTLTREDLNVSEASFALGDADGDGKMTHDEVRAWLVAAPCNVLVKTDNTKRPSDAVEIEIRDKAFAKEQGITVHKTTLTVRKMRIQFAPTANVNQYDPTRLIDQQFNAYDRDKNGYLDENEARTSPYRNNFEYADVDGDKKLFKEEFTSYMKRLSGIQESRTILTARDQGKQLFQILDKNNDNRVSPIELRAGAARVKEWDDDADAKLDQKEVPRVWQFTVGNARTSSFAAPVVISNPSAVPYPAGVTTAAKPWFTRMDRNRDGEVSRREFIGPLEDFGKLDKNNDGVLTNSEVK